MILKKDLHLHPYKIHLTQELKPGAVCWKTKDAEFVRKIVFNDEVRFQLNGYVNTRNDEKEMHPQRVTVWCGFCAGGVVGSHFFEDDTGNAVTVNGERYRSMITDFLWHALIDMDLDEMWFQ